jgi:hypothetical protein
MDDNTLSIQRGADALDNIAKKKSPPEHKRYNNSEKGVVRAGKARLKVTRASEITSQPIEWLLPGKIALGKPTLIAGDPGLGKSLITADMAARVSTGRDWPADSGKCPLGDVLMVSGEDDPADTIRPRLEAAEADLTRVHIVGGVEVSKDNGNTETRMLSLRHDIGIIHKEALALRQCRLIIVDPISAYLDGADSHNNADMRAVIVPLAELASSIGAAILFVTHMNKGTGGQAIYRAMGSLAFVAAARASFLVIRDPQDSTRRLFLPSKNNLGPDATGMAYHIEEVGEVPRVVWEDEIVVVSADDALRGDGRTDEYEATLVNSAAEWLREFLADGPVASNDVKLEAKEAGYSLATLRRAQAMLKVKPHRDAGVCGGTAWYWGMPEQPVNRQNELKTEDK